MSAQTKPWDNKPSGTMNAVLLTKYSLESPATCFTFSETAPKPSLPGPDWLLVKIHAAGLNRAELRARAGEPNIPPEFGPWRPYWSPEAKIPEIIGEEFVGVVEEVGSNAQSLGWTVGDRAVACYYGGGKAYNGSYAEYTIVHSSVARHLPGPSELSIVEHPSKNQVSWTDLAAAAGSAWTAWGSLFQSAQTTEGQTVLVHGATSSVGVWAVLLAKAKNCTVIATTRQSSKIDRLKAAGADHIIVEEGPGNDPKSYDEMAKRVIDITGNKGVNTFLELVNPNSIKYFAFKCIAFYGYIVTTGVLSKIWKMEEFSPFEIPGTRRLTCHAGMDCLDQLGECFRRVSLGIRDGQFKREIFLDQVFDLKDVGKAHERMEANEATGKVVLTISS